MRKRLSRLRRDRHGVSALEFGFVAPFLLLMLLGIIDFGMAYWEQMQLANAADAGAQWAMQNTYNSSSVTAIAENATPLKLSSSNINSYSTCGCPSGSGVATGVGCGSTCPDGSTAQSYVVVTTQICYSTIFHWPGLTYCSSGNTACSSCSPSQISLTSQSVVLQ